jgi:sugar phosphate isomerase/epimerase
LSIAQSNHVEYVLVHFPYFPLASEDEAIPQIDDGFSRLRSLQSEYETRILCEPKLGELRDPGAIGVLKSYSVDRWSEFGIGMCWDVGDYLLALNSVEESLTELRRWSDVIDVIHIHNVKVTPETYYWVPVHPSYEGSEEFFPLRPFLLAAKQMEVTLVWEHTPHFTPDLSFALEGFQWAKEELNLA